MKIEKSQGVTPTETLLSRLCDKTFLKLWSYSNPINSDGKELCDLIAVFEDQVFLFFDRESRQFDRNPDVFLTWERWKRNVIYRQIATARGAQRYLSDQKNPVFLDQERRVPLPVSLRASSRFHKIVVAHGAAEACRQFSDENVAGSLGIWYGDKQDDILWPFLVHLPKDDPVHLFDSENVSIILEELDTIADFGEYLSAKEQTISSLQVLSYCGEEDLLAHYLINFNERTKRHFIGARNRTYDLVSIGEGEWRSFAASDAFRRRREANKSSYLWDEIIQRTCQNALDGTLVSNANIFEGQSAVHEMAKEPRISRRALSDNIARSIREFPENMDGNVRSVSFLSSYYPDRGYVFLQLRDTDIVDYENEYRPKRRAMLTIACGAAKNKFPHLKKVIGIAIDAPKFTERNSEDFLMIDTDNWTDEEAAFYNEQNKAWKFFETPQLRLYNTRIREFPEPDPPPQQPKIGRNDRCPCGSGLKYKRCHGRR